MSFPLHVIIERHLRFNPDIAVHMWIYLFIYIQIKQDFVVSYYGKTNQALAKCFIVKSFICSIQASKPLC